MVTIDSTHNHGLNGLNGLAVVATRSGFFFFGFAAKTWRPLSTYGTVNLTIFARAAVKKNLQHGHGHEHGHEHRDDQHHGLESHGPARTS